MRKSDLKSKLTKLEYQVTQNAATEPPFSGKFFNFFDKGVYKCICCDRDLFSSKDKFRSSTGWPSFHSSINENSTEQLTDNSFGMQRVEVICGNCKAYFGHVFDDGPEPSLKRFCINSAALKFVKND